MWIEELPWIVSTAADAGQGDELLKATVESFDLTGGAVENVNPVLTVEGHTDGCLQSAKTACAIHQRPECSRQALKHQRVVGDRQLIGCRRTPIGAAAQQKMWCGFGHALRGVGSSDRVSCGIVVEQFAWLNRDIATELLRLIIQPDEELVVLDAQYAASTSRIRRYTSE